MPNLFPISAQCWRSDKFKVLIVLLFLPLLLSCGRKSQDQDKPQTYFVKGDPFEFVRGSEFVSAGFPEEMANGKNEWAMVLGGFSEQGTHFVAGSDPLFFFADGESATSTTSESNLWKFRFEKENTAEGVSAWKMRSVGSTPSLEMEWTVRGDRLFLESIRDQNSEVKFKSHADAIVPLVPFELKSAPTQNLALHYSSHANKLYSVLVYIHSNQSGPKRLLAFYFRKVESVSTRIFGGLKTGFSYIFPSLGKYSWNANENAILDLQVCDSRQQGFSESFLESLLPWQKALAGRLTIKMEKVSRCPPFSDLNSKTVRWVPKYVEILRKEVAVLGQTLAIPDHFGSQFLDGDIFFLEQDWQHLLDFQSTSSVTVNSADFYKSPQSLAQFHFVSLHEMGHLLGLGHRANGSGSIMSYDSRVSLLSTSDIAAIHSLYPKRVQTGASFDYQY